MQADHRVLPHAQTLTLGKWGWVCACFRVRREGGRREKGYDDDDDQPAQWQKAIITPTPLSFRFSFTFLFKNE